MPDRKNPFSVFQGGRDAERLSRPERRRRNGNGNGSSSNGEESNPKSQEDRAERMLRKITNRAYNRGRD